MLNTFGARSVMTACLVLGLIFAGEKAIQRRNTVNAETITGWQNAPPTVNITNPANGATYIAPATITINASASDSDGTVSKVEFFQGTTLLSTDTTSPYSYTWNNVAAGAYSLTAKATDNAGAATTSTAVNITVNPNIPPTVSITGPADGATFTVPADISITATASDSGGAVTRVDFYAGATLLGTDTTQPYSFQWHAPAGSHALTAKARDNGGAETTSSPVNITVNPMSGIPTGGFSCPDQPVSKAQSGAFSAAGDQIVMRFNEDYPGTGITGLAPCEQITFYLSWNNGLNNGAYFSLTLYNFRGEKLYAENYNGFLTGSGIFPNTSGFRPPWPDTRTQAAIPSYALFKANTPFGAPANYQISYIRQPRRVNSQPYNTGGDAFSNAPLISLPSTHYGSIYEQWTYSPVTDPGQYYKVRLQGNQGFFVSGYATGDPNYGANFSVEVYNTNLAPFEQLKWRHTSSYGRESFRSQIFVNPGSGPADFYIRVKTVHWPVFDFELNVEPDTNGCTPIAKPLAPNATSSGPYSTTSSEYKFTAAIDPDVLALESPGEDYVPDSPNVLTGRETELWARVYRPADLSGGPFPLLIFLHGNHGACGRPPDTPTGEYPGSRIDDDPVFSEQYSLTGRCPASGEIVRSPYSVPAYDPRVAPYNYSVVASHEGYAYLATTLASRGYIVVSVNVNRGINVAPGVVGDDWLILARGRLVLKHLQKLGEWHVNGGTPASLGVDLRGKLDFNNVGLLGHSRGGQGVRAAYVLYKDDGSLWPGRILQPVTFKGVFEVGPTDRDTTRTVSGVAITSKLEVRGAKWNVLLPMCDGDVSNLQGVRPYDWMMAFQTETPISQKSTYTVWGANHNFYNTQWQQADSTVLRDGRKEVTGCIGGGNVPLFVTAGNGSSKQQQTAQASVIAFFRANVGASADQTFNQNFNPSYKMPSVVTSVTRADRGFTPSPNSSVTSILEDFNQPLGTSVCSGLNLCGTNISVINDMVLNHDANLKAGTITWTSSGTSTYFQANWEASGSGRDVSSFQTLDFRVSRLESSSLNPSVATNFSIQLVMADNSASSLLSLCRYHENLRGPVGGYEIYLHAPPSDYRWRDAYHPILETVRIPLADFTGANLAQVRGVRFVFNGTPTGAIYLANVRFVK